MDAGTGEGPGQSSRNVCASPRVQVMEGQATTHLGDWLSEKKESEEKDAAVCSEKERMVEFETQIVSC